MRSLNWVDGGLELVDQTRLPQQRETLRVTDTRTLVAAIKRLSVRGAPALGVAGAYGVAIAAQNHNLGSDADSFEREVTELACARPTAVNLARMVHRVADVARRADNPAAAALAEAHRVEGEELAASVAMGRAGADLADQILGDRKLKVMTICNTGGLAAVERGTALAVVQELHERGRLDNVLALETRPLLQGARLTIFELAEMGAPHQLIVDSAGPFLLAQKAADLVVVGADRIAANGDTANKIGTYSLALGAARSGVPFVVVAPESTIDTDTATGDSIEIEDRGSSEVVSIRGQQVAPEATSALNPAFDVTPVDLITALVTDHRVVQFSAGDSI